jgi:hypothetical protein
MTHRVFYDTFFYGTQSFPRRRESTRTVWIYACARMTEMLQVKDGQLKRTIRYGAAVVAGTEAS